jgi:hypothetical protein
MRKAFITKAMLQTKNLKERGKNVLKGHKGSSEMVAVIVLIIVVIVIGAIVFLPGLKTYMQDTVLTGVKTATENLFNFKG